MNQDRLSKFIPDFSIGAVGSSTSVLLGDINLLAGISVAIVSIVIMVLRYLDHRRKQAVEIKKLEMDYKILSEINRYKDSL